MAGEFVLEFYRFVVAKIIIVTKQLFYIKSVFMVIIGFYIKKTGIALHFAIPVNQFGMFG